MFLPDISRFLVAGPVYTQSPAYSPLSEVSEHKVSVINIVPPSTHKCEQKLPEYEKSLPFLDNEEYYEPQRKVIPVFSIVRNRLYSD